MSANVTDASELFNMRRRYAQRQRRALVPPAPTYIVLCVENLSLDELAHRLRGTGLRVTSRFGHPVLHESKEPPPAA